MDFGNNHFIAAGNGISGILYGTKRAYNSLYDGKGSKTFPSSTYRRQILEKPCNKDLQFQPTQRSNGFAVGGGPVGYGIILAGMDFPQDAPQ